MSRLRSGASTLVVSLALVYVLWGSTYLGIRIAIEGLPPLILSALRNLTAGALLFAWARSRGAPWPTPRQWRNGALMGFMMLSIGNGFVCLAERSVPTGLAALVVGSGPVFAILFAWGFGTRPRPLEWAGVLLGFGGVALLNLDLRAAASPGGIVLLLVATASWSLASILQPRLDLPKGGASAGVQLLGGGACLTAMAALHGESLPAHVPARSWLALAYLIVFGSLIAYSAFVYVINHSRPALAMSYAYVNPIVAVTLGALFADEPVTLPLLGAMAVILAAVALVVLAHNRKGGRRDDRDDAAQDVSSPLPRNTGQGARAWTGSRR
jgi:drug/metabolite transporter (DMT)-like permease